MALGFKNECVFQEYVYDFAVDGGAVGAIDLSAKATKEPMPVGAVVKSVHYKVLTAFTSAGAATVALGHGDSGTVYKAATAYNDATYAVNYVAASAGVPLAVLDANDGKMVLTVAAAALTAGKLVVLVEYAVPSVEA